jgi:hypothetical protein
MASIADVLKYTVNNQAYERGIKVFVKTDLGKEILVYDAREPQGKGGGTDIIKAGITIKDKDGSVITNYGGYPKTNYLKVAAVTVPILFVVFLMVRGAVK